MDELFSHLIGERKVEEIKPGIWQHTFTPERTVGIADLAPAGALSAPEINAYLQLMGFNAQENPDMFHVSVEDGRRIRHEVRMSRLYRVHPAPRRKIRKCHMRKLQARWRQGRTRIRRAELAERAREEAEMRRVTNGSEPIVY